MTLLSARRVAGDRRDCDQNIIYYRAVSTIAPQIADDAKRRKSTPAHDVAESAQLYDVALIPSGVFDGLRFTENALMPGLAKRDIQSQVIAVSGLAIQSTDQPVKGWMPGSIPGKTWDGVGASWYN